MQQVPQTILVCDDDDAILESVSSILTNGGYRVVTAHDHKEFFSVLKSERPSAIILDVRMPERNGLWLAENLQVLGFSTPIIFLTACDSFVYKLYAPFVGAVAYLMKPVDPYVLLEKLNHSIKPKLATHY